MLRWRCRADTNFAGSAWRPTTTTRQADAIALLHSAVHSTVCCVREQLSDGTFRLTCFHTGNEAGSCGTGIPPNDAQHLILRRDLGKFRHFLTGLTESVTQPCPQCSKPVTGTSAEPRVSCEQ